MNRLSQIFQEARRDDRAVFIPYVTAGDPSLARTAEIVRSLERAGAAVIELGVPFSDPIADGPTNQAAAERSLAAGTTLEGILDLVEDLRRDVSIPIVLFTYANPILQIGVETFARRAAEAGIDGVLLTDVPIEEMARFRPSFEASGLDPILLITPSSGKDRIRAAGKAGSGFLYLVSRFGVTGARQELDPELENLVRAARKASKLPVAVGFGISDADQVQAVARWADGVVVGSAIVNRIASIGDRDDLGPEIEAFVRPLAEACRRTGGRG